MSRWCSNQLSYERNVVGDTGTNISGRVGRWQEAKRNFLGISTVCRAFKQIGYILLICKVIFIQDRIYI